MASIVASLVAALPSAPGRIADHTLGQKLAECSIT